MHAYKASENNTVLACNARTHTQPAFASSCITTQHVTTQILNRDRRPHLPRCRYRFALDCLVQRQDNPTVTSSWKRAKVTSVLRCAHSLQHSHVHGFTRNNVVTNSRFRTKTMRRPRWCTALGFHLANAAQKAAYSAKLSHVKALLLFWKIHWSGERGCVRVSQLSPHFLSI